MLTLILILVASGLTAIVLEVFLPGGVVGVAGALALAVALGLIFFAESLGWPLWTRALAAMTLLAVSGAVFGICMKNFHRTPIGRRVTLSETSGRPDSQARSATAALVGLEGRALTPLVPGGRALIGDKKWEVLSEAGPVATDERVVVTRTEGATIFVRKAGAPPARPPLSNKAI
ncbi:hypothetical protein BH23VER1_BH23VER1_35310 [soil metagenome]